MKSEIIIVESQLNQNELFNRINSFTVTEYSKFSETPLAQYYGKLNQQSFELKNVKYSPMSSAPSIEGSIENGENSLTIIKIKIDIFSHYQIVRKMYYTTLLPIGVVILLLSLLVLGGTEFQVHGFIFSSFFIIGSLVFVQLIKRILIHTKRKEIKEFLCKINGRVIKIENE